MHIDGIQSSGIAISLFLKKKPRYSHFAV